MNRRKLLRRLLEGNLKIVKFYDLLALAQGFGFAPVRQTGSHVLLMHPGIDAMLNLQPDGNEAKPYQIRQLLDLVEAHYLGLED